MNVSGRKVRGALAALLVGGGAGALALSLLVPAVREERVALASSARPTVAPRSTERLSPDEAVVTVRCHGELALPLDAESARLRSAVAELDRPDASVTDLQDLGALLTQLLRERPELGPAAVETLRATHDRRVLFQLSRSLRAVAGVERVRAALLETAQDGERTDEQREAAVLALAGLGDERGDGAFAGLAEDARAGVLARSAATYALARDIEQLTPALRARAVSAARALVATPGTSERLRAEGFDLLGRAGLDANDRLAAREALTAAPEDTAFAAARALLASGEDRASVARALRARASDPALLAQVDLLEGKTP